MRRKFIVVVSLLLISFMSFSNASISYAFKSGNTSNLQDNLSYYFIQFNGDEQEIKVNEHITLTLTGWADDTKSAVTGLIQNQIVSSNNAETVVLVVSNKLNELKVTEDESLHYRIVSSEVNKVETIKPLEFSEEVTVVTENDNGTLIQETNIIDEKGTVIENRGLSYFSINEKNQKVEITKEEYDSINAAKESMEMRSASITSDVTEANPENQKEAQPVTMLRTFAAPVAIEQPSVEYQTHVQGIGWQKPVYDGKTSGTSGQAKRLESIRIKVNNVQGLGVKYSTHVQSKGWIDYVADGKDSGTTGQAKRLEAIKIELTGPDAHKYDIVYRVHAEHYGWLDWVENGEMAGTSGEAKRLEAIEIKIVKKESTPPTNINPSQPSVTYKTHVQSYGWIDPVFNGETSGTINQSKRLEAVQISIENSPYSGGISYKTHVQSLGWLNSVSNGETSGTSGKGLRVEAIQMNLTGELANHYDVYYRAYSQNFNWLGWAKNGEPAGTSGLANKLEAIQIVLVAKGGNAPGSTERSYIETPTITYSTHVQSFGWLNDVKNGAVSGKVGLAKRLEAIKINLQDNPFGGGITYSTHVQSYGWMQNVSNGGISGTSGQGKRMEAIKINLTGEIANYYDVYYRVHIQTYGWLGWAKNGMKAGSEGHSKRLEAIEVKLVPKGQGMAASEKYSFKKPLTVFIDPGHGGYDPGSISAGVHEADLNFAVSKKVQSLLVNRGYTVYMSRNSDTYVSLLDRSKIANQLQPDIFVSIHHNNSASSSANGIESYYYEYDSDYPPKINQSMHNNAERIKRSVTLTNAIQKNLLNNTGANNRGTDGAAYSVIRETSVPATLLELGFLSNSTERQKLKTDWYQNALAKAIADGIDEYFKTYY
ncbi:N-acetylmuramoyl-L-alanine amidase [Fredinandcohnia onubensis]|uniref:N-acetylmuramoyl-L-alanine amidase n=1 Tax=Fredinandcohnia onubensis TaxID=1571209 RepID=UPI000C0C039F|nr:N-acetylmuramoyl-L-alanine amidase [Fredinandcohnia onubensis]